MNVTNGTLWGAREPLKELLKERLPIKSAYWLTRLAKQVDKHCAIVEECRVRLIKENGEPDEKGNITIPPDTDAHRVVVTAMNEVLAEEVEIDIDKIKLAASDDLKVAPQVLLALEEFVEVVI